MLLDAHSINPFVNIPDNPCVAVAGVFRCVEELCRLYFERCCLYDILERKEIGGAMNIQNKLEYKGKCYHCGVYVNLSSFDALRPINYDENKRVYRIFVCTNCNQDIIVKYGGEIIEYEEVIYPEECREKEFSKNILAVFPNFVNIYNQALKAKQRGLDEICGIGYRKSIEFLVKDYAKLNNGSNSSEIESMPLSKVIEGFIPDSKARNAIKRATWLGNDETHYTRKWDDKCIEDIEKLIDIFIHHIDYEFALKEYEESMPDKK